ncbi:MAG: PHP domain-containing protein [Clostridiales bacterium]|nr:PHP domain-containing protein [Clostridiales bacterium]HBM79600.1 hypothetical protein [Clostridiaceae bacterium]
MLVDYHVHLDKLEWSAGTIEKMCATAKKSGVDKVGVVIHTKSLMGFEPLYSHILKSGEKHKKLKFDKDPDKYIDFLKSAKSKGLPILIGVEICYSPEGEPFLRDIIKKYDFDYTIGSVHLIGIMHFKTVVKLTGDTKKVGSIYYTHVLKAINSGLFNIIGHIEVARREGIPGLNYYPDLLNDICDSLIKNNCAIEINTKWLVRHGSIVPERETLKYMKDKGVKLVFGSDAHHIERIGYGERIAESAIADAGFRGFSTIG